MSIIEKARNFANVAHNGQMRKLTGEPYFVHLESVATILKEANFDDEIVASGYLHDTLEDTSATLDEIKELFGERISYIILGNTENKTLSWEERKLHTIESIKQQNIEIKALIAADKLDNIKSIMKCLEQQGEKVWEQFKRGRQKQAWYYKGVVHSIFDGIDPATNVPGFFYELKEKVGLTFGL